jgi:hypothetical protein
VSRYDLKQLSWRDFEDITRDLLQAEWGVALESFKQGPDQGIDLRHVSLDAGTTIVQCKHYSDFKTLRAHLRDRELAKVRKLQPERYVLVTSTGLSAANKLEIQKMLSPFVQVPKDVLGSGDIDGLLARHPQVLRANLKLWLTSTEVLARVVHNATACQTDFGIERVRRRLPSFVQNAALPRAQEILGSRNLLVISGAPGIGKTTLAEILLFAYLEKGYEPVVIQNDVREGKELFRSGRSQVFYFDDFLGQTFLGDGRFPGGVNFDVSLSEFAEVVASNPRARFILTTREHLLQGASQASERLRRSPLMDSRCLLEISDYSRGQRARILYNHLYFSDLPAPYKREVLRADFFLQVVKHEHFNPRLIEMLSKGDLVRRVPSTQYRAHIESLLQNPGEIWSHAFNRQISAAARHVLLCLYSQGGESEIGELEKLFDAFSAHASKSYQLPRNPADFRNALRELDNAFLHYDSGYARFLNPSVKDMLAAEIAACPALAVDLVGSATRFQQVTAMFELGEQQPPIRKALSENLATLTRSIARLMRTKSHRWEKIDGMMRGYMVDLSPENRVVYVGRVARVYRCPELRSLFGREIRHLAAQYRQGHENVHGAFALLYSFERYPYFREGNGAGLQRLILDAILGCRLEPFRIVGPKDHARRVRNENRSTCGSAGKLQP